MIVITIYNKMVCMKQSVSSLPVGSICPMRLAVVWELVSCCPVFCVVRCDAGAVFSFFSASILFGQRRLVVACSCPQFAPVSVVVLALVGMMSSCAISAGLDFRSACPGMVAKLRAIEALLRPFHKGHHSEASIPSCKSPPLSKLPLLCLCGLPISCSTLSSV